MRPKLTWRFNRWFGAGWTKPCSEEFRKRFGESAAHTVETVRNMLREHRDQPSTQDRKATLRALAQAPADADLSRLDTTTEALMEERALLTYRVQNIAALQPEQVAACAIAVLADMPKTNGRPSTDVLAIVLVRNLLAQLPPDTEPAARDELLLAALMQCGFGATPENLRRLLATVGQVF